MYGALRLAGWRPLKAEPKSSVPGYIASSIVSSAVGKKGDPAIGGASTLVALRFDGVPFDVDGMGTSVLTLLRRVAIMTGAKLSGLSVAYWEDVVEDG